MVERCFVTGGLLDALLEIADHQEPASVSTLLLTSPAGSLTDVDDADRSDSTVDERGAPSTVTPSTVFPSNVDPETPVFTDFYLPSAHRSVDAVFGVDVTVPHGGAQGRFVSHPLGELDLSTTDDLHEVVFVAVPPWGRDDVAAFDRAGRRLECTVLDGAPPERSFEE